MLWNHFASNQIELIKNLNIHMGSTYIAKLRLTICGCSFRLKMVATADFENPHNCSRRFKKLNDSSRRLKNRKGLTFSTGSISSTFSTGYGIKKSRTTAAANLYSLYLYYLLIRSSTQPADRQSSPHQLCRESKRIT